MNVARPLCSRRAPAGRSILVVLPVLALSALLTACGGSSSSTASPTTSTTTARQALLSKYTQCLTSHGVPADAAGLFGGRRRTGSTSGTTVPGSSSAPTGTRPSIPTQYRAAFQSCASLRPASGFGGGAFDGVRSAAYRNCLQIHGVTLPTTPSTTPGQAPPPGGFGGGQFANNPKFQAARQACASLLPTRSGSTTTTTVASGA